MKTSDLKNFSEEELMSELMTRQGKFVLIGNWYYQNHIWEKVGNILFERGYFANLESHDKDVLHEKIYYNIIKKIKTHYDDDYTLQEIIADFIYDI
jgi:uncharacterized membrane-anchored protein YjiN (DUF445 family)